jgi:hypothetical protein
MDLNIENTKTGTEVQRGNLPGTEIKFTNVTVLQYYGAVSTRRNPFTWSVFDYLLLSEEKLEQSLTIRKIQGCIQKFPD